MKSFIIVFFFMMDCKIIEKLSSDPINILRLSGQYYDKQNIRKVLLMKQMPLASCKVATSSNGYYNM